MMLDRLVIVGDEGILTRQAIETAELSGVRTITHLSNATDVSSISEPVFVAFSEADVREHLIRSLPVELLVNLVHPTAFVSRSAQLAGNVIVGAQAMVGSKAAIGLGVVQNALSSIEHDDSIGDFCFLGTGAILCGRVSTGEGVFVGGGATVKPGVNIGARSTIGTGAVVVKDVPDDATYVGNPARAMRSRDGS